MSKATVPIIKLTYPPEFSFPNECFDVFQEEDVWNTPEDFTFTGRVSIEEGSRHENYLEKREAVKAKLRVRLSADEAERLITLLDEHGWDVSFFVDCY
jgi:hypothetical protein